MLKWNVDFRCFLSLLYTLMVDNISLPRSRVLCVLVLLAEMNTSSSSIDLSGVACVRRNILSRCLTNGTQIPSKVVKYDWHRKCT